MSIGIAVDQEARDQGLSMRHLARKSGVDMAVLTRMRNEARRPSWNAVVKLADVLGVSRFTYLWLAGYVKVASGVSAEELGSFVDAFDAKRVVIRWNLE
jgi:transcriptional regulator with XRE-family HTH domain